MTDNTQPEALRLADALEYCDASVARQAINELRRQHARIAELEAQLEAVGAGGVEPLRKCLHQIEEPASIAASAGSEPVATVFTMEALAPGGGVKYHATVHKPLPAGTKLYIHPSPPEGMVGGWTKASQQLPPCRDDQLYIGVNTAGFVGVFNAVTDIAGDVHCHYETAEECIDVMSNLDIWQPFTPPTSSADSRKGE